MEFEKLCRELAINAETIKALVSGISQEEAQVKPTPDDWSILEVICHLYDEEHNDFRARLNVILNHPTDEYPLNDPQAWITERGYNQRNFAEMLGKFLEERKASLEWLQGLSGTDWNTRNANKSRILHAGDMFTAWVDHDMHHMRQLVELRRARILTLSQPYSTGYAGDW